MAAEFLTRLPTEIEPKYSLNKKKKKGKQWNEEGMMGEAMNGTGNTLCQRLYITGMLADRAYDGMGDADIRRLSTK